MALDGNGEARYFIDYEELEELTAQPSKLPKKPATQTADKFASTPKLRPSLSTAEKRQLAGMGKQIEEAERLVSDIESAMVDPEISSDYAKLQELAEKRNSAKKRVAELFQRWEQLESKALLT